MKREIENYAARLVLEVDLAEGLPNLASRALAEGLDSSGLRALAGANDVQRSELLPMFYQVLGELGFEIPSLRTALVRLACELASDILRGAIPPYQGAKGIWNLTLRASGVCVRELDPFIYAASEWEDRPSDRLLFDREIVDQAQLLVDSRSAGHVLPAD